MDEAREKRDFRRNFVYSTFFHGLLIGSVIMFAAFAPKSPEQPVWLELGTGGEPGGAGGGDDREPGPAAAGPEGESAPPPPPAAQPEVHEAIPPAPKPQIRPEPVKQPEVKKQEVRQPEIPTEFKKPEKKTEKPKPEPKVQPQPQPQPKKAEPGKIMKSDKLVVRQKSSATPSAANGVVGGVKGGTGKALGSGKNFNAGAFRNKLLGMVGSGAGTGTGMGRGRSGPGLGTGIGRGVGSGTGTGGLPSQFGWYYAMIRMAMDQAWQQPGQLQGKLSCVVYIRIQRDGTITNAWFDRKSGDVVMDESVLSAVNSVRRIAPLPQGLGNGAYADIPVSFELKPAQKQG